jgi:hypothetical protein
VSRLRKERDVRAPSVDALGPENQRFRRGEQLRRSSFGTESDNFPQTVCLKTQSTIKYRDFDLEMDFVDTQLSIIPAKGVGCAACPQNEGILLANSEAPNFRLTHAPAAGPEAWSNPCETLGFVGGEIGSPTVSEGFRDRRREEIELHL